MKEDFSIANDNRLSDGATHRIHFDGSIFIINSKNNGRGGLRSFEVIASMPIKSMARAVEHEAQLMSESLKFGMTLQDCINTQVGNFTQRLLPVTGHANVKSASTLWDAIFQVLAKEYEPPVPAHICGDLSLAKFDGGLV